jgi:hypothetical protein
MTTKSKALEEVVFNDTELVKNKTPINWIESEKLQFFCEDVIHYFEQ